MIRPRRLAHRGHVWASGWLDHRRRRAKVLHRWAPGAAVRDTAEGLALLFPEPRRLAVDSLPGAPLVDLRGAHCAVPLDPDELDRMQPGAGSLVVARGGVAVELGPGTPVDPAAWLDLSGWTSAATHTLAEPPPPATPRLPPAKSADQVFADAVGPSLADPGGVAGELAECQRRSQGVSSWLARSLRSLIAAVGSASPVVGGARGSGADPDPARPALPAGPSWLQRMDSWLASWLANSGLGGIVGAAHSRQLQDLLARFEADDLEEALRRALPLKGEGSIDQAMRTAGLMDSPRSDLSFRTHGPSSSVLVSDGIMDTLRQTYRQALRRLVEQDRIDEAGFLLAELLGEVDEALVLLESHERYERAAELADAKERPAGLRVRLWFLAGEIDLAMAIARRHDAYADAVARLDRSDPDRARMFRIAWAGALAKQDAWAAAAEVMLDAGVRTPMVQEWLLRATIGGGAAGMGALVRAAETFPSSLPQVLTLVEHILEDDEPGAAHRRLQLGKALAARAPTDATRPLMRGATRVLLRDASLLRRPEHRARVARRLAEQLQGTIRADFPRIDEAKVIPAQQRPDLTLTVPASDQGKTPLYDARWLPSGRLLVALGQAGVELRSPRGATLVHWDHPADRLVVSDDGARAIAMDHRGPYQRLTRLDLTTRRASRWCDAEIRQFATSWEGMWFVIGPNGLLGIDPASDRWAALWRMDPEHPIFDLARCTSFLSLRTGEGARQEVWTYALPSTRLVERVHLHLDQLGPDAQRAPMGLSPDGSAEAWFPTGAAVQQRGARTFQQGTPRWPQRGEPTALSHRRWYGWVGEHEIFLTPRDGPGSIQIHLESSQGLRAHLDGDTLTLVDARGRLMVIQLERLDLVIDLRL